jgi:agmatinase
MNDINYNPEFNPSGVGQSNGNFIGLPFNEKTAKMILLPVPWDVTVSYGKGTASAPESVLKASIQLDLEDFDIADAWKIGIFMKEIDKSILDKRDVLRPKAETLIKFLEKGGDVERDLSMKAIREEVNNECDRVNAWVYNESKKLLDKGKIVGIVGGDHSVPLGFIKVLHNIYESFGILQIDAHMDLRESYEGFQFSHASIFHNVLKECPGTKLVQVGVRDYCEEELKRFQAEGDHITVFFDQELKEKKFEGRTWSEQCSEIVDRLPQMVYVSLDADGLDPKLCPNTGTPVPGGLEFYELVYLIKKVVESGRKIIGFDVCETGKEEWDSNVGARLIYKLCNLAGRSRGLIQTLV